jgi:Raf kinase inhibitor-like YbhB/YbcL family protein
MLDTEFKLSSSAFEHTGFLPDKYTAESDNVNPPLQWEGAPEATKSFALLVDDPDSTKGVFAHWLVKDIPGDTKKIEENSTIGAEVENSQGKKGYSGPLIPFGYHRIFFRLYALNTNKLDANDMKHFYREVEKHKIGEAVLMGKYSKEK